MKKLIIIPLYLLTISFIYSQDDKMTAWEVTEIWDPEPKIVTPGKSFRDAPSDAIILFDGQATMGNTVAKSNVNKIRVLHEGKILAGFAGSTADAFTLIERFEEKLSKYGGNMKRSAIELAKDWRMDRYLRRLEAMMIVGDKKQILIVSGTGDVLEPDNNIATIGSGSMYAQAAAIALKENNKDLTSEEIVKKSLTIAADICIYTNHNIVLEKLD